jgi:hypothetical protein
MLNKQNLIILININIHTVWTSSEKMIFRIYFYAGPNAQEPLKANQGVIRRSSRRIGGQGVLFGIVNQGSSVLSQQIKINDGKKQGSVLI